VVGETTPACNLSNRSVPSSPRLSRRKGHPPIFIVPGGGYLARQSF